MKKRIVVFVFTVLLIYSSINYYIYIHGIEALSAYPNIVPWYNLVFVILSTAFILDRFLSRKYTSGIVKILNYIGSFWLDAMLYFFLILVVLDVLRLTDHIFHYSPLLIHGNIPDVKLIAMMACMTLVSGILVFGYINQHRPHVRNLHLHIFKQTKNLSSLKIVAVSDLHMGFLFNNGNIEKLVKLINEQNPDLVLFLGDVVTEDVLPVLRKDIGAPLKKIVSTFGVFGILGNHEYIGGVKRTKKYIESLGVKILRDSSVLINDEIYILGRDDKERAAHGYSPRKILEELLQPLDPAKPVILMDHQPVGILETSAMNIDLQLSGHTHHGQLWPFNYITKAVFEISSGYKMINNTHFYVSNGYGAWGPPIRIGSRPELVVLNLSFNK
ncbi:MAG: metallophosphoesterase [Bacteroidota bacterium]|nr:metallophosphoesterase [Bacteroidota bacterium]